MPTTFPLRSNRLLRFARPRATGFASPSLSSTTPFRAYSPERPLVKHYTTVQTGVFLFFLNFRGRIVVRVTTFFERNLQTQDGSCCNDEKARIEQVRFRSLKPRIYALSLLAVNPPRSIFLWEKIIRKPWSAASLARPWCARERRIACPSSSGTLCHDWGYARTKALPDNAPYTPSALCTTASRARQRSRTFALSPLLTQAQVVRHASDSCIQFSSSSPCWWFWLHW